MTPDALLAQVDPQECIAFLQEIVRHRSYTETPGERSLALFMADRMRALGLEVELVSLGEGERISVVGRLRGTGGGRSLLFNGHVDTNPVTEGWTVDPWGGVVADDCIFGIGVSNMKAGDAAYFSALRTLIESGTRLAGDVILTYVVGELQGGVGTLALMRSGLRADYFVNAEPTDLQALTMHAASFMFTIELTGRTRHLSKREEAVDAIAAACDLVPRLDAMRFSGAASAEHASINRVHVGVMHGALGRELQEWRPPQVADFVRLKGSGRYAPGQTEAGARDDLRRVLSETEARFPGLRAELLEPQAGARPTMPSFEVPRDSPIVVAVNRAHGRVRAALQPTGALTPPGFYGTDAGHLYQSGGMEGVVCGPGGRFNTMPDERVELADYLDAVRIYLLTMLDICQSG